MRVSQLMKFLLAAALPLYATDDAPSIDKKPDDIDQTALDTHTDASADNTETVAVSEATGEPASAVEQAPQANPGAEALTGVDAPTDPAVPLIPVDASGNAVADGTSTVASASDASLASADAGNAAPVAVDPDASATTSDTAVEIETKTYEDGTTATGVAPLPDQSPTVETRTPVVDPDTGDVVVKDEQGNVLPAASDAGIPSADEVASAQAAAAEAAADKADNQTREEVAYAPAELDAIEADLVQVEHSRVMSLIAVAKAHLLAVEESVVRNALSALAEIEGIFQTAKKGE